MTTSLLVFSSAGCVVGWEVSSARDVEATKQSARAHNTIFREIISHPSVFQVVSYYSGPFIFSAMDLRKLNNIMMMEDLND